MRASWRGVPCPSCNRKGLNFAPHPHAFGYKNHDKVRCRYCNKDFNTEKLERWLAARDAEDAGKAGITTAPADTPDARSSTSPPRAGELPGQPS